MSDLNVISKYCGELIPAASFTGDLEVIDFFPHPLEDSSGNTIIDSNGNLLTDATPGPSDPLNGGLTAAVEFTGDLVIIEA